MYKPSLKSTWTLLILGVAAYALYFWAEHSRVQVRQPAYDQKIEAARLMLQAIQTIRDYRIPRGVVVDMVNDPEQTAMIGQQFTLITTNEGDLSSKLTSVNPNFAAVIVDIFHEAGLSAGDQVALGMTGSFPALNIAVLAACRVMDLEPVIISSVGSSWWGANDPDFTWLDMETLLRAKKIFPWKSIAASIGGGGDIGRSLSPEGRELIQKAVERNGVQFLDEPDLHLNVAQRYELYMDRIQAQGYKMYVNIGGGEASLGHAENGRLIPVGYSSALPLLNYPRRGVIHLFADHPGIGVMNLNQVEKLARKYHLPIAPMQMPEVGTGVIYERQEYDLRITWLALILVAVAIFIVARVDIHSHELAEIGLDPDEL